ncbi:hypothetical protein CUC15_05435 [Oceanobacillus zhaokaii]|uniref:DUF1648 domain-containing protein n=1 Tax=Oceanobacillus zhaokaii TaxID=2052660 RepID=A0A345PEH6_9BACI|nr:DUF5808 domain-containing protein [Oceanobacillus zhaokaii]AXI08406.1 hypothetical protein CUC15_05435 [Oceanobacillus zhaokaii]
MNTMTLLLLVAVFIPVFLMMMLTPYLTRKTESFGVTIPEEIYSSKQLKAMRRSYLISTGMLSFIILLMFSFLGLTVVNDEQSLSILLTVGIALYIIVSFIIYLTFHRRMKVLKKNSNWAINKSQQVFINTGFRNQRLTHSNYWFLISFVISIVVIIITFQRYDLIPEQIPMQYNFAGEVTNWVDKSYRSVLSMPIMQLYLMLLFLFINTMIAKSKQQINAEKPEESMRQNIIFRRRWSLYIIVTGSLLTVMFSFIQLSFIYPINQQVITIVPLLFSFIMIIWAIVLSITTGQGGSRVKSQMGKNGNVIDRDDDKYWKLGQFYYNKNDPAFMLEKRFGVGWTINHARPLAWIIILVIIGLAIGIPLLLVG